MSEPTFRRFTFRYDRLHGKDGRILEIEQALAAVFDDGWFATVIWVTPEALSEIRNLTLQTARECEVRLVTVDAQHFEEMRCADFVLSSLIPPRGVLAARETVPLRIAPELLYGWFALDAVTNPQEFSGISYKVRGQFFGGVMTVPKPNRFAKADG